VAAAAALSAFGPLSPCHATTLAAWTLEDFVANSNAVVAGTVTGVDVRYNEDKTQIHSYVTIAIDQVIAGEALPNPLVLDQLGGRVGRRVELIEGAPVYRQGESVLVFVEKVEDVYRTLGFYQGKYNLETDPDTGWQYYVQRVPAGGVLVLGDSGVEAAAGASYRREELVQRVRDIAGVR
jgi:hypothetical protein